MKSLVLSFGFAVVIALTMTSQTAFSRDHICTGTVVELPSVDGHDVLILRGRCDTLHIKGKIDGQSNFDTRNADIGEIIIDDKIDGQSTVWLKARGSVRIGTGLMDNAALGPRQVEILWSETESTAVRRDGLQMRELYCTR